MRARNSDLRGSILEHEYVQGHSGSVTDLLAHSVTDSYITFTMLL
jgi:hypothetical protein